MDIDAAKVLDEFQLELLDLQTDVDVDFRIQI